MLCSYVGALKCGCDFICSAITTKVVVHSLLTYEITVLHMSDISGYLHRAAISRVNQYKALPFLFYFSSRQGESLENWLHGLSLSKNSN